MPPRWDYISNLVWERLGIPGGSCCGKGCCLTQCAAIVTQSRINGGEKNIFPPEGLGNLIIQDYLARQLDSRDHKIYRITLESILSGFKLYACGLVVWTQAVVGLLADWSELLVVPQQVCCCAATSGLDQSASYEDSCMISQSHKSSFFAR